MEFKRNTLTNSDVYIEKREVYSYPLSAYAFSPFKRYPEYMFGDVAPQENAVYDMVRACFKGMGLDEVNYGTPQWNPLGQIISQGDRVVIKPNMVIHEHLLDSSLGLDSLITHPSIVRAVTDYCLIALKGEGSIIIGDAPLQSCDFGRLVQVSGYDRLMEFYDTHNQPVALQDFRLVRAMRTKKMGVTILEGVRRIEGGDMEYQAVDIGKNSALMGKSDGFDRLRVTNYDPAEMIKHHNSEKNEYLLPRVILDADVIINLPKPKTHSKAGITVAMKNLVGINGHKDWLPHHTKGSKEENGDEYLHSSFCKKAQTFFIEKSDVASAHAKASEAAVWALFRRCFTLLSRMFSKDLYCEGSWYGNDTVWRMVNDLTRILLYADKFGRMCQVPQRRWLHLGDMIVSGEGEGPMKATAKPVGCIVGAANPLAFDSAVCALMGMDWRKVPSVRESYGIYEYPVSQFHFENIKICSNDAYLNNRNPHDLRRSDSWKFEASCGWKGHIELD